jgi:circadian clock protein KaiC
MTQGPQETTPLARVPSGVSGLDVILRGGFAQGDLYIIMGPPGTGKTVLANQICFNHVKAGGRALYVTLLAETHGRMLAHLRSLDFYDPAPIADALYYISAYRELAEQGLRGLLDIIRRTVRERHATLLVIDGFVTAAEAAQSDVDFKRFLHELQVYLEPLRCTTLLLMQYSEHQPPPPEHTMVDGLIELSDNRHALRVARELEVRKLRGSAYLRGRHFFTISDAGIAVFPRIEVLLDTPHTLAANNSLRHAFGIEGLDAMLAGGLLNGSTTLLLGAPGTGKTMLGVHFLAEGAQQGETALHFGFYESPSRLVGAAARVGLDIAPLVASKQLVLIWQPPLEHLLDELAQRLLQLVREHKVRRLFIDGIDAFREVAIHPERLLRFFVALFNELREQDVTAVCSLELRDLLSYEANSPLRGLSALVENIILLRHVERGAQTHRLLSIVKLRGSEHATDVRTFQITSAGIDVASSAADAENILRTERADLTQSPGRGRRHAQGRRRKP